MTSLSFQGRPEIRCSDAFSDPSDLLHNSFKMASTHKNEPKYWIFEVFSLFGEQCACRLGHDQNSRVCKFSLPRECRLEMWNALPTAGPVFSVGAMCPWEWKTVSHPSVGDQCYRCHGSFHPAFLDSRGFQVSTGIYWSKRRLLRSHSWEFIDFPLEGVWEWTVLQYCRRNVKTNRLIL